MKMQKSQAQEFSFIIAAGGQGSRFNSHERKQFMTLNNKELWVHSAEIASQTGIDEIILVIPQECMTRDYNCSVNIKLVAGGSSRPESVMNGLLASSKKYALIHDGARPFITAELISEVLRCARECGASAPAVPVVDTIKEADGDGYITCTLDRSKLRAIATPQIFRADLYKEVIADEVDSFDDCQLFEKAGYPVRLVPGDAKNFKITTRDDIARAKQQMGISEFRIGHGYDVHRLVEDRKLIIGGVDIPFDKGLLGHSDADVLLHAISDAVLGAASLRDIGYHFPDTDPKWEGADSRMLLRECVRLVNEKGYRVANVDATILCQRPKLAPYIDKMRSNIAEDMKISEDAVSVKATTEEGLGFTGEGKGIASHAVVLIREE